MQYFKQQFTEPETFILNKRKPDFENLLKVLQKKTPSRPTLFEFFLNNTLHNVLSAETGADPTDKFRLYKIQISAFLNAGYDYLTIPIPGFNFPKNRVKPQGIKSISLNDGGVISDWESFEKYPWMDPNNADYDFVDALSVYLPEGMKFIAHGPGGVLENVIAIVGFDNLCYMIIDEPELAQSIFDAVGSRFVKYYEYCSALGSVGAVISNDDWGFSTQTMLSVTDMRKYVIPWHKRIVAAIHNAGKPAILHSCGRLDEVMDDIIDEIGYDAKHSYEDKICPVEDAYENLKGRIAVLGGIDVDFLCRSAPNEIYNRSVAMLERSCETGGFALGSGNSIPEYVPVANYLAMIAAVTLN